MKAFFKSLILIALVPLITLAIEPMNPQGFCDRFLSDKDIEICKTKTEKDKDLVDWYAATVCNLQQEDSSFWTCWESIRGQSFNPAMLENCGDDNGLTDTERQNCLLKAKAQRLPASIKESSNNEIFQKINTKIRIKK